MTNEQEYLIQLIKSSLNGTMPQKPSGISLKKLYDFAAKNQYEHIIYAHFKALGIHNEKNPLMHLFHQRYGLSFKRDCIQDKELNEISGLFSENNIKHIFLKGSIVKKYYPQPFLRRSGDIDILVNSTDKQKADEIMKSLSYKCTISGNGVEDVYERGKSLVEIHTELTADNDISLDFCKTVWENSVCEDKSKYNMTPEYMYVYLMSHLRKHILTAGGGGIKLISDFYMLNKKIQFDKDALDKFTEEAKINNLRKYAEKLSLKWFDGKDCSDENVLMLEEMILSSGAHGDYKNYIDITLSKNREQKGKISNLIQLVFPPLKTMRVKYNVLEKKPYLLPLSWIWRMRDAKKSHTKTILKSSVSGLSENEAKRLSDFCSNISK